jgi:hypothetical protein
MNLRKFSQIPLICLVAAFAAAIPAQASTINPGLEWTTDGGEGFWGGSIGYEFVANVNTSINALGAMSIGATVGLWDTSGKLLISAVIGAGDTTVGHFTYHDITPFDLTAGTHYIVAATPTAYQFDQSGLYSDPQISYLNDRWAFNGDGFVFPDKIEGTAGGFPGGTVSLSTPSTPEPATLGLLGLGLAGLSIVRRRSHS